MRTAVTKIKVLLLILIALGSSSFGAVLTLQVGAKDIYEGNFVKKIALNSYSKPTITLSGLSYIQNVALPKGAKTGDPMLFRVVQGMELKKPFILVSIPAYVASSVAGQVNQLATVTINYTEDPTPAAAKTAARFIDAPSSVLANGTWYKIGITKTGFYKLDFSFFNAMGISASAINPANIRIFGNGGAMLSEDNNVERPADLIENAILVNDGGDNAFNAGDFAVFYAVGPTTWSKDSVNQIFRHKNNIYADTAYYFVSVDNGAGKRVSAQSTVPVANATATGFNYYDVHDLDLIDPSTYGKTWFGEMFSDQVGDVQSVNFDLGDVASTATLRFSSAATQGYGGSTLSFSLNGSNIATSYFGTVTNADVLLGHVVTTWNGNINSRNASINMTFVPSPPTTTQSSICYLDYVEVNARRPLNLNNGQLSFRDWQTVGAGKVVSYGIQQANSATSVWDVTDPHNAILMNGTLSGTTYTFAQDAAMLHEFAATNGSNFYTPTFVKQVPNQNLHALPQSDLIIVVHPAFYDAAKSVADYHKSHDNLRVALVTTEEVYNEFSSGAQDISAIRDFARMFYKRATDSTQLPKYLLLYGNGSYDYKYRLANNANFVPTYETANDSSDLDGFLSDDFFGFLDDNEYIENYGIANTLDIGVGRIPARNLTDATVAANKIVNYKSAATLGPWRIASMVVAEKSDDAGDHMGDAEIMSETVADATKMLYNQQKVYVDAIPIVVTPGGPRCPNANAAINDQIYQGVFMVNYNGHGNPQVWANERILTQDDFNNWNNVNSLPFMATATCDFGQFDHPAASAAELMMLHDGGGAIAMVTTTGAVYEFFNKPMNIDFLDAQFTKKQDGTWNTFGDACRISKNVAYSVAPPSDELSNFRKFVLLGDPALIPDFPQYNVKVDSVVDGFSNEITDSVKALGKYILHGSVRDLTGSTITNFNGTLNIAFFDKPSSQNVNTSYGEKTFSTQLNLIYKGTVSVTNGLYEVTFIAPKDINYFNGTGKISTYAQNGVTDAAGSDTSFIVGGFSDHPVQSTSAPVVRPYMNDSFFVNGGITGSNTSLFVELTSETGINVTGYSIGHNLTGVLDGNVEQPYILNNYYETAPNTYQKGFVLFPIQGLADGHHTITVKAYDVNNNSGEGTVDFTVINGTVVDIQNLSNYPNPFSNLTHFVFEHNHPDETLDIQIAIYDAVGAAVKTIKQSITPSGSRTFDITWDGTDNNGAKLASGVYVYRFIVTSEKGYKSTAYQKLVIVR